MEDESLLQQPTSERCCIHCGRGDTNADYCGKQRGLQKCVFPATGASGIDLTKLYDELASRAFAWHIDPNKGDRSYAVRMADIDEAFKSATTGAGEGEQRELRRIPRVNALLVALRAVRDKSESLDVARETALRAIENFIEPATVAEGEPDSWIDNLVGVFDDSPLNAEVLENERRAREAMDAPTPVQPPAAPQDVLHDCGDPDCDGCDYEEKFGARFFPSTATPGEGASEGLQDAPIRELEAATAEAIWEMSKRLQTLGYSVAGRGGTLWGMVMDAADDVEKCRNTHFPPTKEVAVEAAAQVRGYDIALEWTQSLTGDGIETNEIARLGARIADELTTARADAIRECADAFKQAIVSYSLGSDTTLRTPQEIADRITATALQSLTKKEEDDGTPR